jgi:hypothetical protein
VLPFAAQRGHLCGNSVTMLHNGAAGKPADHHKTAPERAAEPKHAPPADSRLITREMVLEVACVGGPYDVVAQAQALHMVRTLRCLGVHARPDRQR